MDRLEGRTGYREKQTENIGLLNLDYASCSVFLSIVASSLFFLQQESRTLQEIIQNGKSNIFSLPLPGKFSERYIYWMETSCLDWLFVSMSNEQCIHH